MSAVGLDYYVAAARRIVVKIGTSLIALENGVVNEAWLAEMVKEIVEVLATGREVILVTSGAIGAGAGSLGLASRPQSLPEKQAAAAVGQGVLMRVYSELLHRYSKVAGQVLLTREDLEDRRRYLNARHTLLTLLKWGVFPIINENDTVAVEEIRVGDNDTLSALVASLVDADLLVILTDIEGLYTSDPRHDESASLIPVVEEITPDLLEQPGTTGSIWGTGGMATKLAAARIATAAGIPVVVAGSRHSGVLTELLGGRPHGTLFFPAARALPARRRWIAFGPPARGRLYIDAGAARAVVSNGKSLLPSGIVKVEGNFTPGQVVSIINPEGQEIARGLVNYTKEEVEKIRGRKTSEIGAILGHKDYDEVVHRDNLVIMQAGGL